jgi:hypothetical protein
MGSRERKRSERRKRKRRSAEREPSAEALVESEAAAGMGAGGEAAAAESFSQRMSRRSEAKNQAVRETLEPLEEGERPGAVTVAAGVSGLLALILTISAGLALAGVEIGGEKPTPVPVMLFAVVVWSMTWGLWKARYWAVLGFQMILVLLMLSSALGLLTVGNALQALGTLALLAGSAVLFYFMIRAMARIQMPQRPDLRASGEGTGKG